MRALKQRQSKSMQLWLSLAIAILLCLTGCISTDKLTSSAAVNREPSLSQLSLSVGFPEPVVSVGATPSEIESQALKAALIAYKTQAKNEPERLDAIESFIKQYPKSSLNPSLRLNLGLIYNEYGRFSLALSSLRQSYESAQSAGQSISKQAVSSRALGELAILEAYLGRYEELDPLLKSSDLKKVQGPATELLASASVGLLEMYRNPGKSFRCGPLALSRICNLKNKTDAATTKTLEAALSTKNGTSLGQVYELSKKLGLDYQIAVRSKGAPVLYPAVVHWKVGHFSAILSKNAERYQLEDPTHGASGSRIHMTQTTLDEEASGYFLVPAGPLPDGWRTATKQEAASVWGRGNTGVEKDPKSTTDKDIKVKKTSKCPTGMTDWDAHVMTVSLSLSDIPVGFSPAPFAVPFQVTYAQRETGQPATFGYTNFGPKWTCNWLSIVNDSPSLGGNAELYERGGGRESFVFTGGATTSDQSYLTLTRLNKLPGGVYRRDLSDGTQEIFEHTLGNQHFLTKVIDPQGNTTTISYDSQNRIQSVTDPVGRVMTLAYEFAGDPLKVTKVTDPFGRSALFNYTADGHLASTQDVLGIVSSYQYGSGDFINQLTTPYGTTTFSYGDLSTDPTLGDQRFLTITDPAGRTSRVESRHNAPGVPEAGIQVPQGMNADTAYTNWRNSFYWEPKQLQGGLDYTKATLYHFVHTTRDGAFATSRTLESMKEPLKARVWYDYPGQGWSLFEGTLGAPVHIGQVLGDGTSQVTGRTYNAQGNINQTTDALGRVFSYTYAPNGIDLLSVSTGGKTLMAATYDGSHNILTLTDAAGSTSSFTYDARGQMLTATNSLGETSTYTYSDNGNLLTIAEPLGKITTFAYDSAERLASATDSEGYTVTANYDSADRPVSVTYPDGTTDQIVYDRLDTASTTDRLGRKTSMAYDALQRLTQVTDPNSGTVGLSYGIEDSPTTLTDQGGRQTQFAYDLQQRLVSKQYAGGATQSITYQNCCGRLRTVTDALGHTKTFNYYLDNTLKSITYSGTTPAINFTTDPFLPRPLTMTDGQGTTNYSYVPVGSPGANGLESVTGPLGDQASFQYDAASRMTGRMVNGSAESQVFDPLWRTTSTTNALDTFNMTYLGKTGQVTGVTSASGPTSQFTYHPNTNDRRLAQIKNLGRVSGTVMSQFDFTQDTMGQITKLVETHGSVTTGGGGDDDCHKKCCHGNKCCKKDKCCKKKCCKGKGKCGKDDCKSHHHGGGKGHDDDDDDHHHSLVFPFTGQSLQIACLLGILFASAWMMIQIVRDRSKARPIFARVTSLLLLGTVFLNGCLGSAPTPTTSSITQDFSYDKLGQLIGISVNNTPSASFQFDPSGNLVSLTSGGTTSAFTYNSLNQPTTPAGTTFDAKGQTTVSGGKTFEWDDEGRLTAIVNGSARSEFGYDGYGRRISITEKSGTTITSKKLYWWLGGSIVCERDGLAAGNPITKRYFGQGVLVGAQKLFYTFDQLGSVRELVDDTGAIRADYRYDNYGTRTKSAGDLDSDFGYAGLFHHAPSGLLLATHRAYDPVSHRWLSRDPLGEGVDLNLYRYVGNSPHNFSDPEGLNPAGAIGLFIPGIGEVEMAVVVVGGAYYVLRPISPSLNDILDMLPDPGMFEGSRGPNPTANITSDRGDWGGDVGQKCPEAGSKIGRGNKKARLLELLADPKVSKALRGWIQQEVNAGRQYIRVPRGYNLAHRRGFEAKKGFDYLHSDLQHITTHKTQHRIGGR